MTNHREKTFTVVFDDCFSKSGDFSFYEKMAQKSKHPVLDLLSSVG